MVASPVRRSGQDVPIAVRAFANGEFVLVMDDFDRENECDLIVLGETLTKEQMAFMIKHSTGIVCAVADKERLEKFGLYPAARQNTDKNGTAFYVATDYLPTTTTGVSARDRCETVRAFCREESKAEDFSKPGHMFPLCPRPGGVLERGGHTESAYDLCRLAGRQTVAAIGELMGEDGEMLRLEECIAFSKTHRIPLISVDELREWVRQHGIKPIGTQFDDVENEEVKSTTALSMSATLQEDVRSEVCGACSTCTIPVRSNHFGKGMRLQMYNFKDPMPIEVIACIKGDVRGQTEVPIRIHSECFTGDVLRSAKCDCGLQLEKFFALMERETNAVLLYIRGHEGRGIGLSAKFDAYRLQTEENLDTVDSNLRLGFEPDLRSYRSISSVIQFLGIQSVRLFTNNPEKIAAVEAVVPVIHEALKTSPLAQNIEYLKTKERRMDHRPTMEVATIDGLSDVLEAHLQRQETPPDNPKIEFPRFGDYQDYQVVIVATSWNKQCSNTLVEGCEGVLLAAKCAVTIVEVPDALDLVAGCNAVTARESPPNAIVALGTYVRGETDSSQGRYEATVSALQALNVKSSIPIISGVSLYNSQPDAIKRSCASLGAQWGKSALQMLSVCAQ